MTERIDALDGAASSDDMDEVGLEDDAGLAYVIIDGTLIPINRVAADRFLCEDVSGTHKHGVARAGSPYGESRRPRSTSAAMVRTSPPIRAACRYDRR